MPIVFAGVNQELCFEDTVILNLSGNADSYSWSNGIANGVPFQVTSTQDYILTGIDLNNCFNQDTVTITVNPLPNVEAGSNTSVCLGDSLQLNASNADSYIWLPNYNIINNNIINPTVYPKTDTIYFVTGIDTNGCSNIDSVQVTIDALPTITTSNDTAICIGDTIGILAGGGISYDWLTTDSISDITVANPNIWPTNSNAYQVYVVGTNNCGDTAEINITVNNLPNIDAGVDVDLCFGDTTQLTVSVV